MSYDLGYAYFKSKNFTKAKEYFKEYLKNPKPEFKSDAELRLADTYYAGNELNEAIAISIKQKVPMITRNSKKQWQSVLKAIQKLKLLN